MTGAKVGGRSQPCLVGETETKAPGQKMPMQVKGNGDATKRFLPGAYPDQFVSSPQESHQQGMSAIHRAIDKLFQTEQYTAEKKANESTEIILAMPPPPFGLGAKNASQKAATIAEEAGITRSTKVISVKKTTNSTSSTNLARSRNPHSPPAKNHEEAIKKGWKDISHPKRKAAGHHDFIDPESGKKWRYDEPKPGRGGHREKGHWHQYNENSLGDHDMYLDVNGNPCAKDSPQSHIYPE